MENTGGIFRKYRVWVMLVVMFVLLIVVGVIAMNYPKKMKKMFVESSVQYMEEKLYSEAEFTNENIILNYAQIYMLENLITKYLDGTKEYPDEVYSIMETIRIRGGFDYLAIRRMDSDQLFATLSDGSEVQLDIWVLDMEMEEDKISVEVQTSPFKTADEGKDAVVYRYTFSGRDGAEYMLLAEKPQETLESLLNIKDSSQGITLMVRENGNVVYSKGRLNANKLESYNFWAYLEKAGASQEFLKQTKEEFEKCQSGVFQLEIDGENNYFVFNKIQDTNWSCIKGYSESILVGNNLGTVNGETMRLVTLVGLLMILAMIFSLIIAISNEKKQSERKAIEREKLFEEMSRCIPNAFAILKKGELEPTFVSYNFYEVIQQNTFDFSSEGIYRWLGKTRAEVNVEKFNKEKHFEAVIEKNHRHYAFGIYDTGIVNKNQYYTLVFTDVTDDIRARKLLENSMKRADEASKSKTQFLSKMSHEIRTPLNSVIGFSKLSLERWDTTESEVLRDYMSKIQSSGTYLLELVSDILDISRIEEGRMEIHPVPYSLGTLVDEVRDSFLGQMEGKHIRFEVEKDFEDVTLNIDVFHVKQILNNLISNACKYTEEGGEVMFYTNAKSLDDKRMSVQFAVDDTGIGMSEEFQKKIFEPFTQEERGVMMKKQLRGTGLGMSICKNLVEMQDGTIKVWSELGKGSEFTVQLTFEILEASVEKEKEETSVDYSILDGKKILVVDDIEMNRIIVEKFLSFYGIVFDDAENGQEAVEKVEASKTGEYFAIFMDVQMPILNGYQATERIRKLDRADAKTLSIVGMTADAFSDDVNKAMISGMNYHVTKPIQIEKVLGVLMEIQKTQLSNKKG